MASKRTPVGDKQSNDTAGSQYFPHNSPAASPAASNDRVEDELRFATMAIFAIETSSAPTQIISTRRRDSDPSATSDQRMVRSVGGLGGWVNAGSVSGSESQSQRSADMLQRQTPANLPHVDGYFMPPGGWNPDPPPVFDPSAVWSHLPPPYLPGVNIHEGDPATAPRKIINSIEGIYPNTMRDTPSPPPENRTQNEHPIGAAFSTPIESFRETFKWGPESNLKPYNWPDSRHKYPGGPVFPEPEDGFSKKDNEKFDHCRAIMDWWKGHEYSVTDLATWVNDALRKRREYDILNYWVQYKMPPGMNLSLDMKTLGPEFEELVERANALQAERVDESAEGAKGEKKPTWKYHEIEPGESANPDWKERGPLKRPGSAGREEEEMQRQRGKAVSVPGSVSEGELNAVPTGSRKPDSMRQSTVKGSAASARSVKSNALRR